VGDQERRIDPDVEEALAGAARQHALLLQKEGGHARTRFWRKKKKKKKKKLKCFFAGSIRLEPGMKVREEKNCKKSPFAFVVETPVCFASSCVVPFF
jgi:hypothetical protein